MKRTLWIAMILVAGCLLPMRPPLRAASVCLHRPAAPRMLHVPELHAVFAERKETPPEDDEAESVEMKSTAHENDEREIAEPRETARENDGSENIGADKESIVQEKSGGKRRPVIDRDDRDRSRSGNRGNDGRDSRPDRLAMRIAASRESIAERPSPLPGRTPLPTDPDTSLSAANRADDYAILFQKKAEEAFGLHVVCRFTLHFGDEDTIAMRFGGAPEFSVSDLRVRTEPETIWHRDPDGKSITFVSGSERRCRIRMEYDYLNLHSALVYRDCGCELWETSYDEFYYPLLPGERCRFEAHFELPEGCRPVGGYPADEFHAPSVPGPLSARQRSGAPDASAPFRAPFAPSGPDTHAVQPISGSRTANSCGSDSAAIRRFVFRSTHPLTSHSLVFALVDTTRYRERTHVLEGDTLRYWLMPEPVVPESRIEELHRLTAAAIAFFERSLGPYDDPHAGISAPPVYLFHGSGYSNRNNLNLISLSQAKVAAKPHLLPVAHELGHRWLGEWTLFVPDGAEAAYFLKESLVEYMTLLFARSYYGRERFRILFETEYLRPAQALRGTADDRRLIDMRRNNNDRAVYAKGPVVLEKVASAMGYERWIAFMRRFYTAYRYRPLTYADFVGLLAEEDPIAAAQLDRLVRTY